MKKYIALLVSFILVCSMCACGNSGAEETKPAAVEGLQVGYARMNITPDYEVGLGGAKTEERGRMLTYEDVYNNAMEIFSGRQPHRILKEV